jgi:LacI family transcriptional regulator
MKVTRKFIAEKAGVSATTVSYVINNKPSARVSEKVRKHILKLARKYNYIPDASARALVTGKTGNIGFIYKSSLMDFFSDPFTHEVFAGIDRELEKNDYNLIFSMLKKSQNDEITNSTNRMISGNFVDGIIIYGNIGIEIIKRIKTSKKPFVLIDYYFDEIACNSILPDNERGAREAVQYLIKNNCSNICCLNGDLEDFEHPAYVERPTGYTEAMNQASLPLNIISTTPDISGSYATVMNCLKNGNIPDAFFATGDHIAIGCLKAVVDFDRKLLEKVRIIGFDEIKWSEPDLPLLSTVSVPKIKLGEQAMKMLFDNLNSKDSSAKTIRLSTKLTIKET